MKPLALTPGSPAAPAWVAASLSRPAGQPPVWPAPGLTAPHCSTAQMEGLPEASQDKPHMPAPLVASLPFSPPHTPQAGTAFSFQSSWRALHVPTSSSSIAPCAGPCLPAPPSSCRTPRTPASFHCTPCGQAPTRRPWLPRTRSTCSLLDETTRRKWSHTSPRALRLLNVPHTATERLPSLLVSRGCGDLAGAGSTGVERAAAARVHLSHAGRALILLLLSPLSSTPARKQHSAGQGASPPGRLSTVWLTAQADIGMKTRRWSDSATRAVTAA